MKFEHVLSDYGKSEIERLDKILERIAKEYLKEFNEMSEFERHTEYQMREFVSRIKNDLRIKQIEELKCEIYRTDVGRILVIAENEEEKEMLKERNNV